MLTKQDLEATAKLLRQYAAKLEWEVPRMRAEHRNMDASFYEDKAREARFMADKLDAPERAWERTVMAAVERERA